MASFWWSRIRPTTLGWLPAHRENYRRQGVRAFLAAPVKIDDKVIGVLGIRTCRAEGFSKADVEMARALASQAAIALENSRLYQELQRAFDELAHTQDQLFQAQKMEAIGSSPAASRTTSTTC